MSAQVCCCFSSCSGSAVACLLQALGEIDLQKRLALGAIVLEQLKAENLRDVWGLRDLLEDMACISMLVTRAAQALQVPTPSFHMAATCLDQCRCHTCRRCRWSTTSFFPIVNSLFSQHPRHACLNCLESCLESNSKLEFFSACDPSTGMSGTNCFHECCHAIDRGRLRMCGRADFHPRMSSRQG